MLISGITLFYYKANVTASIPQYRNIDQKMITSGQLKRLHEQVTQRLLSFQDGSRREYSDSEPQLKAEDKVHLLTQKQSSQQTTRKLDCDKVRPSLIPEVVGPGNFVIRIYADGKIHPGVHTPSFESADLGTPLLTPFHEKIPEESRISKTQEAQREVFGKLVWGKTC